jgi:AraC-like DNA-binding protein
MRSKNLRDNTILRHVASVFLTRADGRLDNFRHYFRWNVAMGRPLHRRVVPATYVQLLFEYLEALRYSPEAVIGEPWPELGPDGLAHVDVELWDLMLRRAAAHLSDPLLGLHVGQTITSQHLGILGAVLLACENLSAALLRLERYQRLIFDVVPMTHRTGPGYRDLIWDTNQYKSGRLVEETGYSVLVQFTRSLVREPINPLMVRFAHSPPADVRAYEDFFGCPILFDQPESGVRWSLDISAMPLKRPDPALISLLEQHANTLLERLPQQPEIVEQVRKAISDSLQEGEPDIEKISAKLSCSSRTLQRRLFGAETNFRTELSLVRRELAVSYLRDPRLQIVDIALLLGYSEHSAFTRAFRDWTGESPQAVRQRSRK